jgi:hypothetical protein
MRYAINKRMNIRNPRLKNSRQTVIGSDKSRNIFINILFVYYQIKIPRPQKTRIERKECQFFFPRELIFDTKKSVKESDL